jgi:hypothetical protein
MKIRGLVSVFAIVALMGASAQAASKKSATARSEFHTTSNFKTGGLLVVEPKP